MSACDALVPADLQPRPACQGAQHVKVTAATFEHGLLTIDLKREVPEALKPRRIELGAASGPASVSRTTWTMATICAKSSYRDR